MSVSLLNNFNTPILDGKEEHGQWEQIINDYILVSINSDTNTALTVYQSHSLDFANLDHTDTYSYVTGSDAANYEIQKKGKYIMVKVANSSGGDQTMLRVYTHFKSVPSSLTVDQSDQTALQATVHSAADTALVGAHASADNGTTWAPIPLDGSGQLDIRGLDSTTDSVSIVGTLTVDITEADDSILCYGNDGANNQAILTHTDGSLMVKSVADVVSVQSNSVNLASEATVDAIKTAVEGTLVVSQSTPGNLNTLAHGSDGISNLPLLTDGAGVLQVEVISTAEVVQNDGNNLRTLAHGSDGVTPAIALLTDATGILQTAVQGAVDCSAATVQVQSNSLNLATETTLGTVNTNLGTINTSLADVSNLDIALSTVNTSLADVSNLDVALSTIAKEATLGTVNTNLGTINTSLADVSNLDVALSTVNTSLGTINTSLADVSNLDIALSTVNTSLGTINTSLVDVSNLDVALSTIAKEATLGTVNTNLGTINTSLADVSNLDIALSTINTSLGDLSNLDVALSTVATEATLADIKAAIEGTVDVSATALDIRAISSATDSITAVGSDGVSLLVLKTDNAGKLEIKNIADTVNVASASALDVSAATVNVASASALDVSAATVQVQSNSADIATEATAAAILNKDNQLTSNILIDLSNVGVVVHDGPCRLKFCQYTNNSQTMSILGFYDANTSVDSSDIPDFALWNRSSGSALLSLTDNDHYDFSTGLTVRANKDYTYTTEVAPSTGDFNVSLLYEEL